MHIIDSKCWRTRTTRWLLYFSLLFCCPGLLYAQQLNENAYLIRSSTPWQEEGKKESESVVEPCQSEREGESESAEERERWEPEEEFEEPRCPGDPIDLEAEFGEGFALVSEDEEFELRIHLLNQVDFKFFSPAGQEPAAIDGVYIPRFRVYFEGKVTDPFRYELSLQRSIEGEFDLLDANIDIRFSDRCNFRIGRTLIPYSYTWYDHLEQYFIVPERSLFPLNFGLSRAAGIQLWGEDELRRWQYSVGAFDGRVVGLADDSTTTDAVGYLNLRPFVLNRGSALQNFNVGGSLVLGRNRRPAEFAPGRTSVQSSENDEASIAASAVFLEFDEDAVGFGGRTIGAVHAAWYGGPMSVEAEWNALEAEVQNEETGLEALAQVNGFHVTVASFITGERIRGREVVRPCRPFDPRCGCRHLGAFEPYFRYSYIKFNDAIFDAGFVDGTLWTDEVSMSDIGINWYLNEWIKFYFDWQHAAYASPVLVNEDEGRFSNYNNLFWARCQFYF